MIERKPASLLTYDTFGTPSFYQPAGPGLTSHNARAAPVTVPSVTAPLGGYPNVG